MPRLNATYHALIMNYIESHGMVSEQNLRRLIDDIVPHENLRRIAFLDVVDLVNNKNLRRIERHRDGTVINMFALYGEEFHIMDGTESISSIQC